MSELRKKLDLAAARARLEGARGSEYWRSLDELAATPEFQDLLEREFPRQAIGWSDDEDPAEGRRNFLKLMGASLALAGLAACTRQPTEHIMPYIRQPEELIPGRPLFYATPTTLSGVATGMLAESHEGRPTKIEGNPEHPGTLGACDALFAGLGACSSTIRTARRRSPSRARSDRGAGSTAICADCWPISRRKNGAGIRILTETVTSPSMADLLKTIQTLYPQSKWHQWEPAGAAQRPRRRHAGFRLSPPRRYYNFLNANVVVSLDCDFLRQRSRLPALCARVRRQTPRAWAIRKP